MIIWSIAILLMIILGFIGHHQGGIRVAISLIGLLISALLSVPLSPIFQPLVALAGIRHPILKGMLAPALAFLAVLIVFKIIAQVVHRKVDHYYKYKVEEVTRMRWERLNQKLGLSLGIVNGVVYFFLLLIPVYVFGYLTVQLATGEEDTRGMRILNKTRAEMRTAKMDNVMAAYDPAPQAYYDAADILGLVKHNPLLESRLSRYPAFLSLAETPEFQAMATDTELQNLIVTQAKISDVIAHPKVQAVLTNAEINKEIIRLVGSDLKDLRGFIETGRSVKYGDEKILGRWQVDLLATIEAEKKRHPDLTGLGLKQLRSRLASNLRGMVFIATTDNRALLKRYGSTPETSNQFQTVGQGTWKKDGEKYEVTLQTNGKSETVTVTLETDDQMSIPTEAMTLVMEREI